ncbi:MAG: hypothetical protein ACO307_10780, partial [Ilumatobacteraceae bacterium]
GQQRLASGNARRAALREAMANATEAEQRAAFNWYSVSFDGSRGAHNAARAVRLLAQADLDLKGAKDLAPDLVAEVLVARLSKLAGSRR